MKKAKMLVVLMYIHLFFIIVMPIMAVVLANKLGAPSGGVITIGLVFCTYEKNIGD